MIFIFISLIFIFYKNNKNDFDYIYNLNLLFILKVTILSIFYLVTEALIFKNITKFFLVRLNFFKSFLVISTTYLCNTFVQFSGLGYRAYYLKKFKGVGVTNFIIKSIFIIFVELLVFSFISFILLIFFDQINNDVDIFSFIYLTLILIFFSSLFFLKFSFFFVSIFKKIKILMNFKYIKKFIHLVENFDFQKFNKFIYKYVILFLLQYLILFLIFYSSYSIFQKDNSILFSLIATMSTDFSFLFTLTPYAIGISETFIFFSSNNFDIKISEILFLTNIFRLSMFSIYFIFGLLNLFYFSRLVVNKL